MSEIHALAADSATAPLRPFSYDPGPLGDEQVEIAVEYCGLCHSDYSLLRNEFQFTRYPFVPGHEAIGTVVALGEHTKGVTLGQKVGLGWNSGSCLHCRSCLRGDQNLCSTLEMTIVGRHGAFATRVRCHWIWATPIPEGIDLTKAGPLLCGGITVFNPLIQFDVNPTSRVGVVGIGGLGHLALQFLNKWGCHVTAFTTSDSKADEAKKLGAHEVLNTRSDDQLKKAANSFDLILSTVMVPMNMDAYLGALAPRGRFHLVGLLPTLNTPAMPFVLKQLDFSGTPSGAPGTVKTMLDFCVLHGIAAITEEFPMSKANEALEHLEAGKARYRVVLKQDLG
jgi:uncharacterized zinc-type alcohol dehydrogenase-like protein